MAPSRRRISASAVRPARSTLLSASRSSASASGSLCRTAPTWSTITLTAWATMSWSSRAIRARSSATAMRAAASRSRSAWAARTSAASACSARSAQRKAARPRRPTKRRGMKMRSARLAVARGCSRRRSAIAAERRCRGRCTPSCGRAGCRAGTRLASPTTSRLPTNATSTPSTNESAAAEEPVGRRRGEGKAPAREERQHERRPAAGTENHSVVVGAPGESRPTTSSHDARDRQERRSAARTSTRVRRMRPMPAHALKVLHALALPPPT